MSSDLDPRVEVCARALERHGGPKGNAGLPEARHRRLAEQLLAALDAHERENPTPFDDLVETAKRWLAEFYPSDVPLVCDRYSDDPGPRLAAALRDCLAAQGEPREGVGVEQDEATYWNGERCEARIVRVIVADDDAKAYWARPYVGQEREAVEVVYNGKPFYIDNEAHEPSDEKRKVLEGYGLELKPGKAGDGWWKVTVGRGGPRVGHRSLTIERVVEHPEKVSDRDLLRGSYALIRAAINRQET